MKIIKVSLLIVLGFLVGFSAGWFKFRESTEPNQEFETAFQMINGEEFAAGYEKLRKLSHTFPRASCTVAGLMLRGFDGPEVSSETLFHIGNCNSNISFRYCKEPNRISEFFAGSIFDPTDASDLERIRYLKQKAEELDIDLSSCSADTISK